MVLTKTYKMSCEVEEDDPFSFEGSAITSCEGWGTPLSCHPSASPHPPPPPSLSVSFSFFVPLSRCKIDWKKAKNLTVKTIKKKQKHKG